MRALNLPEFEVKLKKSEGKVWIFDVIRKKDVILTPEEWVRQHLVHFFINHLKYPKSLISIERGLQYNQLLKRSDILIFDRAGKPWMLVECKSFEVKLDQQTIQQTAMYNTNINARYVSVSNGMKHICYEVTPAREILMLKDFPAFT